MTAEPVTFTTYEALIAIMRERRIELGLSQLAVDEIAGLASGYQGKIEASLTNPTARNARSIGRESQPLLLRALKGKLAFIPDDLAACKTGYLPSDDNRLIAEYQKKRRDKMAKAARSKWAKMSPKQRAAHIRKMNLARAAKHRKEKAATKRTRQAVEVVT
ncbi:hypothetical protein [Bosea sp. BK604]|uniref:helix-turn-helix domain-containing protein n=1 Tax=Bosea sp. BK604 TaxID=2512180 RepID=UPI0010471A9E|nr:hypothetical protein [Bosea sp. BK604]